MKIKARYAKAPWEHDDKKGRKPCWLICFYSENSWKPLKDLSSGHSMVSIIFPLTIVATTPPANSHSPALISRPSHMMFPCHRLYFPSVFSYLLQRSVTPSEKPSLTSQPGKALLTAPPVCKLALPNWSLPPLPTTPETRHCQCSSLWPQRLAQWLTSNVISY